MAYISRYTDFHIAKSPLLCGAPCVGQPVVRGCCGRPGAAPARWEGAGGLSGCWDGAGAPGRGPKEKRREERKREEPWRAAGCRAGGISCPNPGHVARRSPAALPASVGHSAPSGACERRCYVFTLKKPKNPHRNMHWRRGEGCVCRRSAARAGGSGSPAGRRAAGRLPADAGSPTPRASAAPSPNPSTALAWAGVTRGSAGGRVKTHLLAAPGDRKHLRAAVSPSTCKN